VDLPGRDDPAAAASATPDDVIGAVVSAIIDASEPVVLVGHSLAGAVIGHAAQRVPHLIDTLVYLAAFAPKPGTSALDVIS
jgi:predicted alpha/beta hydrolase family esterase